MFKKGIKIGEKLLTLEREKEYIEKDAQKIYE